jgi:hypothetical protein
VTDPGRPALFVDRLEAVVFDTDGVLTDTASVHAADVVVTDLGELALQGGPVRRGHR